MRKLLLSSLVVIAALAGCSTRSSAPAPQPVPAPPPGATAVAPATVVFTGTLIGLISTDRQQRHGA